MYIRGGGFVLVVPVYCGRGEGCAVILSTPGLLRCPGVGQGLDVHCRVAEHFLEVCIIQWAVDGGVESFTSRGEGGWPISGG